MSIDSSTPGVSCFTTAILSDIIVEGEETFTLQLSTDSDIVFLEVETATVVIEDDDRKLKVT